MIEHKARATRADGRMTLSELAEFVEHCQQTGAHPSDLIKATCTLRGYVRWIEAAPDTTREDDTDGR